MIDDATVSHKLKAPLASSLTSTNCKRFPIITVEGCGLTIAHAYFGFDKSKPVPKNIFARSGGSAGRLNNSLAVDYPCSHAFPHSSHDLTCARLVNPICYWYAILCYYIQYIHSCIPLLHKLLKSLLCLSLCGNLSTPLHMCTVSQFTQLALARLH